MGKLDVSELSGQMSAAALKALGQDAPKIKSFAVLEFKKMADTLASIELSLLNGEIDKDEAKLLVDMQKNSSRAVMLAIEGLGAIAVEQAINSAIDVAREAVNTALDLPLL